MQVGQHALPLLVGVEPRALHLVVHRLELLRGHLEVGLGRVLLGVLLIRLRHLRQLRQPPVQLRRLLRELRAVRLVLALAQLGMLLRLVLEMAHGLGEVLLRLLNQAHDLALLEGGRDHVPPLHALGHVDRHAVPVHAQLLQRVGHVQLLRARLVGDLGDELAAGQRRQVDVDVDRQLAVRPRRRVDVQPIHRLEVPPRAELGHEEQRGEDAAADGDGRAAERTDL